MTPLSQAFSFAPHLSTMDSETPSIQDDSTWTTGDVSLISSDHVRIKVSSTVLVGSR